MALGIAKGMDTTGFEPVTPTVSRWCATPTLCVLSSPIKVAWLAGNGKIAYT